jgi:hypothetical protein
MQVTHGLTPRAPSHTTFKFDTDAFLQIGLTDSEILPLVCALKLETPEVKHTFPTRNSACCCLQLTSPEVVVLQVVSRLDDVHDAVVQQLRIGLRACDST